MKAQCDRCKEIVALEFVVEGTGIRVSCPGCAARYLVQETGAREPEPPTPTLAPTPTPTVPVVCPKCGEGQGKGEACRKCGLVFAKWNPQVIEELAVPGAAELWEGCEAGWAEEARHDAFIELCRRGGGLPYAAAKYRQRGDAERVAKIRTLAEQTLAATPRPEPAKRKTGQYVLILVLMIVLLIVVGKFIVD